jgi:hypothetical protein
MRTVTTQKQAAGGSHGPAEPLLDAEFRLELVLVTALSER